MQTLTHFVLSSAAAGGCLVLGAPQVFGSLLLLRYPGPSAAPSILRTGNREASAAERNAQPDGTAVAGEPPRSGAVIPSTRLESLRASRKPLRMPAGVADDHAA